MPAQPSPPTLHVRPATRTDLGCIHTMICALCGFQGGNARSARRDLFRGPVDIIRLGGHVGRRSCGVCGHHIDQGAAQKHAQLGYSPSICRSGAPNQRRATALIKALKTLVITQNATRLTIGTDVRNMTAIGAYRRMAILNEIVDAGPQFRVNHRGL